MKRRKNKSSNLLLVVTLCVAVAIVIISLLRQRINPSTPNVSEVGSSTGKVDLTLTPASSTLEPNQDQVFTLTANVAANEKLTFVQVAISYDSSKIGTPTVTKGSFLTNELDGASVANNKITFAYGAALTSGGVQGSGTVATITIHPTVAGTSNLTFIEGTEVYVVGQDNNMLKSASGSTITVGSANNQNNGSPSPSPSPSPSVSPSPSPSQSSSSSNVTKTTSLRLTSATCNSLSFSWDKVGGSGYEIDLADNSNFDNKLSSGTLGSDRDSYTFNNLTNGKQYYTRITVTNIPDYPHYTKLNAVSTLGSCAGAVVKINNNQNTSKTVVKASPKVSPKVSPSPSPRGSLEPTSYTDNRFDNVQPDSSNVDNSHQSWFSRFIAWLVSLFK